MYKAVVPSRIRVAVIGAGAAGLAALRRLTARPELFQPVAFEQTTHVGGTWVYTDRVGTDDNGIPIHSSMYKHLVTNLPKEIMAFQDFPFPEDLPSFIRHQDVLKYLQDFAKHYDLYRHIEFNTIVESIRAVRSSPEDAVVWEVGVRNAKEQSPPVYNIQRFDAVMVCNGHYSMPMIPSLPGVELFHGQVLHSHDYRDPEQFRDKTVVCLGAGISGMDIASELSAYASKIYLVGKGYKDETWAQRPLEADPTENIHKIYQRWISGVTPTGVVLESGEEVSADVIVICTGYQYTFPFLQGDCKLDVTDGRVTPLWKHMVHVRYPSLFIIGMPKATNPFPMFDWQVQFAMAILTKPDVLPSVEQMETDIHEDFQERLKQGLSSNYAHFMGAQRHWEYVDELADLGGFARLPLAVHKLFVHLMNIIFDTTLAEYRQIQYRLTGPDTFEVLGKKAAPNL